MRGTWIRAGSWTCVSILEQLSTRPMWRFLGNNRVRSPDCSYFLSGQELRGFGVKVIASGLKTFVVQYRNAQGRSRRIMIGRYGVVTVEQARREAKTVLGQIARGVDPLEEK